MNFAELGDSVTKFWRERSLWQRVVIVALPLAALVGILVFAFTAGPAYELLYSNLAESDRLEIERRLADMNVEFESNETDSSIRVPSQDKNRVRMALAREGFPRVRTRGYQLFDTQRLGATEFEQRLNYQRALQEELQSTIEATDGVIRARVLLVTPRPTVFTEREKPPKASVLLTLRDSTLGDDAIKGIVHLVANAVEGLQPENVVVSDSSGRTISKRYDALSLMTEEQREFRELEERTREEKILNALSSAYGNRVGQEVNGETVTAVASVNCTAVLEHDTVQTETTQYQPDTVVQKEHIVSENAEGVGAPAVGVPGVTSNILGIGSSASTGTYSREESTTEYQAGVTKEIRRQAPRLNSLSTAVLVNSQVLNTPPGPPGQFTVEQQQIESIIAGAVGYDAAIPTGVIRRPEIAFISFAPLVRPTAPPILPAPPLWLILLAGVLGLVTLVLVALLLKPRFFPRREEELVPEPEVLPTGPTPEDLALEAERRRAEALAAVEAEELERRRRRRQELIDLADAEPDEIAKVLRTWLEEEEA
jgi:flagellar M-ring protein FliF